MECTEPTELLKRYQADGWQMQFSASGDRLREMVENYEMMGLEVKTLPYTSAVCGGCTICYDDVDDNNNSADKADTVMMILTRKRSLDKNG